MLLYSVPRLLSANTELGAGNVLMGERGSGKRSGDGGESCVTVGVQGEGADGSTASGT